MGLNGSSIKETSSKRQRKIASLLPSPNPDTAVALAPASVALEAVAAAVETCTLADEATPDSPPQILSPDAATQATPPDVEVL